MKISNIPFAKIVWHFMVLAFPQTCANIMFKHLTGGSKLDLKNPKDLNEKINYLKFHSDMNEWARLADKYAVREYVKERGLEDILIPLYGKWKDAKAVVNDWKNLPKSFVLKTNHACGTVRIIKDKDLVNLTELEQQMKQWLKLNLGILNVEPHYTKIKPCLYAEQLIEDNSVEEFSQSLIDYKIWCFNGKPYCFFIAFDRSIGTLDHHVYFDAYDLNWNRIKGAMSGTAMYPNRTLPKPQNFERLLEVASILSKGHKQVRVDLYNINGRIYFGEMTFTSQAGYMRYFTKEFLLELGSQFEV